MATVCNDSPTALLDERTSFDVDPRAASGTGLADSRSEKTRIDRRKPAEMSATGQHDAAASRQVAYYRDLIELTKPRIVTMILVTTAASAWIAIAGVPGATTLSIWGWMALMLGTGLVAASAGAANQIWERVIDTRMPRTASRPVASGRMSVLGAVAWTGWAGLIGSAILFARFGSTPALVGAVTWLLYVLVYTPMKQRTAWNTTIGAVAGAIPVFIGYTAGGGGMQDLAGWMLFGVLACWQYPHFMAIAWLYRRQYAEAGFHMTTTVEPTGRSAAIQSIVGTLALAACGVVLCAAPLGSVRWTIASLLTSMLVLAACWPLLRASLRFAKTPNDLLARKMLRWSLVVLPAVLLVMTLRMINL